MALAIFLSPATTALVATIAAEQESPALSGYCRSVAWPRFRPARQLFGGVVFCFGKSQTSRIEFRIPSLIFSSDMWCSADVGHENELSFLLPLCLSRKIPWRWKSS